MVMKTIGGRHAIERRSDGYWISDGGRGIAEGPYQSEAEALQTAAWLAKSLGTSPVSKAFGDEMQRIARRKSALTESTGTLGGYLVPPQMMFGVDRFLNEYGIFHNLCRIVPMESRECDLPNVNLSASHATGESPLFGGFQTVWTAEGVELDESEPQFSNTKLTAQSLAVYVVASNQLVSDGGEALGVYLETLFGAATEWAVERACFNGNGIGKPTGIVNAPATVAVTRATANDVRQVDLAGMVKALIPACYGRAVWCCNPSTLIKIAALSAYHVNPSPEPNLCGNIFGRPLFVTEKLPALGTRGDVVLFDPAMYALGRRRMTEVAASPHPKFLNAQTVFRVVWRGDGRTIPSGTCTLADESTTAGCFVALAA